MMVLMAAALIAQAGDLFTGLSMIMVAGVQAEANPFFPLIGLWPFVLLKAATLVLLFVVATWAALYRPRLAIFVMVFALGAGALGLTTNLLTIEAALR